IRRSIYVSTPQSWRKTSQELMRAHHQPVTDHYDLYPAFHLSSDQIHLGFNALAEGIREYKTVVIDGYGGVLWETFRSHLDSLLRTKRTVHWIDVNTALHSESAINELAAPYLGGDDPIFGTRFNGTLRDFFDMRKLQALQPDPHAGLNILYGSGAALAGWQAPCVYVDVPKNEIQFRSRARSITNLGAQQADAPQTMYKRFYFVDWVALNAHKASLLPHIDWLLEDQRPDEPSIITRTALLPALKVQNHRYFSVLPQ